VLNQAVLARQIGISTTPLREALRRLAQQGLVELGAHRDARSPRSTPRSALHLCQRRAVGGVDAAVAVPMPVAGPRCSSSCSASGWAWASR
jgi:DNA-binding GntR family transcriptional regulator